METNSEVHSSFNHLLDLNKSLFDQEQYEAAYHVLAAAYHVAVNAHDKNWLCDIRSIAQAQANWIDHYHPDHPFAARITGNQVSRLNVFCNWVIQAEAQMKAGTWGIYSPD